VLFRSTHADLAVEALQAGKHVFCEKPLALTYDELLAVEQAWRQSPGHLMVGFNRRWSPAVTHVQRLVGQQGGALVLTYRVSGGALANDHWYNDRRQGGRLIGEVCHFIDTCNAIVGAKVLSTAALGSGRSEVLLDADLVVTLRYSDGSVATISYASGGHAATPKERLEVHGRGHSAVVDDYRRTVLDGRTARESAQDKGHLNQFVALRRAIRSGSDPQVLTEPSLHTMAVTLAAAEALRTGQVLAPLPLPG
jgi:predicted dehydrogenase